MMNPKGIFLEADQAGHALLARYRKLLAGQSEALAKAFYDYLLNHEQTAQVFASYTESHMQRLAAAQAEHAQHLLTTSFDEVWSERVRALGRMHQAHGIAMSWIAGAYLIYQRHWEHLIHVAVPAHDSEALRNYLHQLLIHDLMLQLDGYQCGVQETDQERSALFLAMLRSLTGDTGADALLCAMCRELIRDTKTLRWSWYAILSADHEPLRPQCEHGIEIHPVIADMPDDPCWKALRSKQAIIFTLDDSTCPEWLLPLRTDLAEIAIIPFGIQDQNAVGVVGSKERGYFQRVGIDNFSAFAHMGDLVIALQHQSRRDPLTGLPNRMALDDQIEAALKRAQRYQKLLAIVMCDLDGFKSVNDIYGHGAGDQLLVTLCRRLQESLRAPDSVIRLGGDEFVFLLNDLERWTDLEVIVERIRQTVEAPYLLGGSEVRVGASLGVTLYPLDDGKPRDLLHHADLALYDAKAHKATRAEPYVLYDPMVVQDANSALRVALRDRFRRLLDENVVVLYQPILDVKKGTIHEVEALARLREGDQILSTGEFLPYLTPTDLRLLSHKVLEQAGRQWRLWKDAGHDLIIGVNFEPRDILDAAIIPLLQSTLEQNQMPADRLMIEVLEGGEFIDVISARKQLLRFKEMGLKIALDDMGSAYANLLRFKDYPFDVIKLDQVFSLGLETRPRDLHFLLSMLDMAKGFGVDMIVEGVESPAVLAAVQTLGVSHVQGYAIAKPLPAAMLSTFLMLGPYGRGHRGHLLAVYAQFMVLARGMRTVLSYMPQAVNAEVLCNPALCPLHGMLNPVPNIDVLLDQLQQVVAQIANGYLNTEEGLLEYDLLVASILGQLEGVIEKQQHILI
jgi:diguanylate cyclase (GGDEF)-like protein